MQVHLWGGNSPTGLGMAAGFEGAPPAPPLLLTATPAAPLHRKEWYPVFGGGSLPLPAWRLKPPHALSVHSHPCCSSPSLTATPAAPHFTGRSGPQSSVASACSLPWDPSTSSSTWSWPGRCGRGEVWGWGALDPLEWAGLSW